MVAIMISSAAVRASVCSPPALAPARYRGRRADGGRGCAATGFVARNADRSGGSSSPAVPRSIALRVRSDGSYLVLHYAASSKSAFLAPQSGQVHDSGTSSHRVPGARFVSGSPASSSYTWEQMTHTYFAYGFMQVAPFSDRASTDSGPHGPFRSVRARQTSFSPVPGFG